ncbi:MAG: hypothetical protein LBD63_01130 [Mycoplasmataceae bacterium]|jgi:hypothetical protein|nr:hypothetical protein [Mycoplasmataceae bacterium]
MLDKHKTIKVNIKDENEWIEKLKVQPTVRIDLDHLTDDSPKSNQGE